MDDFNNNSQQSPDNNNSQQTSDNNQNQQTTENNNQYQYQQQYQTYQQYQPQTPAAQQQGKGFSIASMVLGIISVVFCCYAYIAIICGIAGIVLGAISIKNKYAGRGMAIAGLVLSIIGVAFYAIILIVGAAFSSELMDWANSMR